MKMTKKVVKKKLQIHQFVEIGRALHVEFSFFVLESRHQRRIIDLLMACSTEQPLSSITYFTSLLSA